MIDWSRLAEPQPDYYDTAVTLKFATAEASPRRGERYVRRPTEGCPTIFDGDVAVRHLFPEPRPPNFQNAPFDRARVEEAVDYVRYWPVAFNQFRMLMDTFNPIIDKTAGSTPEMSFSHSDEGLFGTMYGTCHDPVFLAECFVHEMAHNKLRALGVGINAGVTLVLNPPDELYVSPIIKHRKRPMTAVLHATYSFLHVAALDVHVLAHAADEDIQERFAANLRRNLFRLHEGCEEVRRYIRVDSSGRAFVDGLLAWGERVAKAGEALV